MREAALVKKMMKHLEKSVGGLWIKISAGPFQVAGLPDIVGCCQGKFFALEVKLPGKEDTYTPLQQYWVGEINKAGGKATMVTTILQAVNFVKSGLKK